MNTTESYRKHGALLSLGRRDVAFLLDRGLGVMDAMGDRDSLRGVHVPGDKIDRHIQGEEPTLRLVGGVMVARGEVADAIVAVQPVNIDGIFDEETT